MTTPGGFLDMSGEFHELVYTIFDQQADCWVQVREYRTGPRAIRKLPKPPQYDEIDGD